MSRIGVFGGSFNPVHNGHLALARAALDELNLDKVLFVPTNQTPLREEPLMPAALRVRLLKAAVKGERRFEVSAVEVRRKGLSFTVDTLKYLKAQHGPGTTLYFLSGADVPSALRRWKSWNEIPKLCRFVVMSRPGHPVRGLPDGVHFVPFDALEISSTEIRRRLTARQTVRGLVPDAAIGLLAGLPAKKAAPKPKKGDRRSTPTRKSK